MDERYINLIIDRPELFKNIDGGIEIITDEKLILDVERKYNTSIGIAYEDEYLILLKDAVRLNDGVIGPYIRAYHKNSGGVAILVICDGKILLINHFRHSLRRWIWETPRGFGECGQSAEQNVARELSEEIGVVATRIEKLGNLVPDAGIIGETINLYCAHITPNSKIMIDKHEGIKTTSFFTKEQLKEAILNGEIIDGITIASLTYAELKGLI